MRVAGTGTGHEPVSGQSGFGLLESVVSIALTSIVVLALATGLLASVKSSVAADQVQRADAALTSFSESVRSMPAPPEGPDGCPQLGGPDGYSTAYSDFVASAEGWELAGVTTSFTKIEHWDPSEREFTTDCPDSGNPHVHRLGLSVEVSGDSTSGHVVVAS